MDLTGLARLPEFQNPHTNEHRVNWCINNVPANGNQEPMHGEIGVDSTPGKGSYFYCRFNVI
jgi:hypothetical protein